MAARIRQLYREMGEPRDFTVVELGAGRGEMAEAFSEWRYLPVDLDSGELPEHFSGVVFSNEFFDALPVDVAVWRQGAFREQRVAIDDRARSSGARAVRSPQRVADYLRRYFRRRAGEEEVRWYEVNLEALDWMERIAGALAAGFVLTIDYGYTRAESVRFPAGTLMGYQPPHRARECVGASRRARHHRARQLHRARRARRAPRIAHRGLETLARTLLAAGEADQFARRSDAADAAGATSPPHAAQDAAVRNGRDVPRAAAGARDGEGRTAAGSEEAAAK